MENSIDAGPAQTRDISGYKTRLTGSVSRWALAGALGALMAGTVPATAAADIVLTPGSDDHVITSDDLPNDTIDAGDGFDFLTADVDGYDNELDMSRLLNFESYTMAGSGELTLLGDGSAQQWAIQSGLIIIDQDASIGGVFGCCAAPGTSVINFGTVAAGGSIELFGVDDADVFNYGLIEDGYIAVSGEHSHLLNAGIIHGDSPFGALMSADGPDAHMVNDGGIYGSGTWVVGVGASGSGASLINFGDIVVEGDETTGAYLTGDAWELVNVAGAIVGDTYGARLEGDDGSLVNSGLILALSEGGAVAGASVTGDYNSIENTGEIVAGVGLWGDFGTGSDTAPHSFLPDGLAVDGNENWILNDGLIAAAGDGANGVSITGADNTLVNTGDIAAQGDDAFGLNILTTETHSSDGTTYPETVAFVVNTGRIYGTRAGVRYGSSVRQNQILVNELGGLIAGELFGVRGGDGNEIVHNYGTIQGATALDLGLGEDVVYFYGGSSYEGLLDGGAGYDEFHVTGEGELTLDLSDLTGFELHQLDGPTLLTLTGEDAGSDWFINGGQIIVAEGARLRSIASPLALDGPAAAVAVENNGLLERITIEAGGSVVENNGDIINDEWGGYGISVFSEDGGIAVTNNGTILASGPRGVGVALGGGGHQLINASSITVMDPEYGIGVQVQDDNNIVLNTGSILAENSAVTVDGDDNAIVNFASSIIRGAYADLSYQATIDVDGSRISVTNAGLITAGYDADGEVFGDNRSSVAIRLDGEGNEVRNEGSILGAGFGIQGVGIAGSANDLINDGVIRVEGDEAIGVRLSSVIGAVPADPDAPIAHITNFGLIEAFGTDANGIAVFSTAGTSSITTNWQSGTIEADGLAFLGGDGADVLGNYGTIIGGNFGLGTAIDMGAGDDVLSFTTSSRIIGLSDGGEGLDRISLRAGGDEVGFFYGDNYVNFEQILVFSGDWRFAGNSSFDLLVTDADTRLGGNGTLTGDVIINGILAPGNSIGRLDVTGDVTLTASSVFAAEVSSVGLHDRLVVDGAITLQGGDLMIETVPSGVYSVRSQFTLMTASDGISGSFGSVSVNDAFNAYARNNGNAFDLVLVRQVDFTGDALTPNAAAVGGHLNAELGENTGQGMVDLMDGILALSASDQSVALQELSGDVHASQIALNNQAYGRFMDSVSAHVRNDPAASGYWLEASGRNGEIDSSPGVHGLDTRDRGLSAGVQLARGQGSIGLAIGFNHTDATGDHVKAETDNFGATAYAVRQAGAYTFSGQLGWMSHDVDTRRAPALGFVPGTLSAGYRATTLGVGARIARQSSGTMLGGAMFEPELALNLATTDTEDFSEAGDPVAALNVRPGQMESLTSKLGASLVWGERAAEGQYSVRIHGAWLHEYLDETATLFGGFQGASSSFLTESSRFDRDRFQAGVSMSARMGASMHLRFDYLGESSGSQTGHSLSARLVAPF